MQTLISALVKAKLEFPKIIFDSKNPHFKNKYVSLYGLLEATTRSLANHNLIVTFTAIYYGDQEYCQATLRHGGTDAVQTAIAPILCTKNDAQGWASANTYAKRQAYSSLLAIAGDDDDDAEMTVRPPVQPIAQKPSGYFPPSTASLKTTLNMDETFHFELNAHKAYLSEICTKLGLTAEWKQKNTDKVKALKCALSDLEDNLLLLK